MAAKIDAFDTDLVAHVRGWEQIRETGIEQLHHPKISFAKIHKFDYFRS
jgi:hypothetical protein